MSWEEVSRARTENRRELVLQGKELAARLASNKGQLDPGLFTLTGLNFLELSGCPELTAVPDALGRLAGLTTLVAAGNALEETPSGAALAKLDKLKVLDLSGNKVASFPEEAVRGMKSLTTLNLSVNKLSSMPDLSPLSLLSHLDLSANGLTGMDFVCGGEGLTHLSDVCLAKNRIATVPAGVSRLSALKRLDLSGNALKSVPGEVADCLKLKELLLAENPLSADNRLKKMVAQKGSKPVIEYIRQHCPKVSSMGDSAADGNANAAGGGGKKGKGGKKAAKKAAAAQAAAEDEPAEALCDLLEVMHLPAAATTDGTENCVEVTCDEQAREARPYIVCFVARDLDLTSKVRPFLQAQTRLHESVCDRRNAATIATHDLAKIPKGKLLYTAKPPKDLKIVPLGRGGKEVDGETLVTQLMAEGEAQKKDKAKKRGGSNNASGVGQFLRLLSQKDSYACLLDSEGKTVSFPPITNCDGTKISPDTRDILAEVTSETSLGDAKRAADALVSEMLDLDLGVRPKEEEAHSTRKFLKLEPVRVTDQETAALRVVYPARTDLQQIEARSGVVVKRGDQAATAS